MFVRNPPQVIELPLDLVAALSSIRVHVPQVPPPSARNLPRPPKPFRTPSSTPPPHAQSLRPKPAPKACAQRARAALRADPRRGRTSGRATRGGKLQRRCRCARARPARAPRAAPRAAPRRRTQEIQHPAGERRRRQAQAPGGARDLIGPMTASAARSVPRQVVQERFDKRVPLLDAQEDLRITDEVRPAPPAPAARGEAFREASWKEEAVCGRTAHLAATSTANARIH